MPVRTGDRIDGHYVWSVEGLGPDSLNDAGEVAFLDLYVNQISSQGALSSLRRAADVGDSIDGFVFAEVKAGFQAAIDGAGHVAFQGFSPGQGDVVFAVPDFASPNLAALVGATSVSAASHPATNEAGDFVLAVNWCTASCFRRWIVDRSGTVLADEIFADGFTITDFDVPALNELGAVAFVASHLDVSSKRGVYRFDGATVTTLLRDGQTLVGGTLGSNCCPVGLDLDDAGRIAVMWPDSAGDAVLVVGDAIALRQGDTLGERTITFLSTNANPAMNGAGVWAVPAGLDGGWSDSAIIATGPTLVAREGDLVSDDRIESLWGPSVNEAGQIAFQVMLGPDTFSPRAAILATPAATNARVRLASSSPAAIRQSITAPLGATHLRFARRFETAAGTLTVRFAGQTIGTIPAPVNVQSEFARERLLIDGALLGQTGDLEVELDGPAGSRVLIDDVVFPGIANGHFQSGGVAGWTTTGSVTLLVPEAAPQALAVAAALALVCLRCARRAAAISADHSQRS
jgi:hypothetical protein